MRLILDKLHLQLAIVDSMCGLRHGSLILHATAAGSMQLVHVDRDSCKDGIALG